jgi:RNA polymerase sigma-70 factor (ECF subfamily)
MSVVEAAGSVDLQTTLSLIASAKDGDREALEELFRRYAPRTLRIAALRFGWKTDQFADYEDIAQDALLRAFKGLHRFDPTVHGRTNGAFRSWLACCVESAIREHLRRKNVQKRGKERRFSDLAPEELSSSIFAGRTPSPSQLLRGTELERRLEAALLDLQERYRDIIIYRQLCGMSYEEIAGKMAFANVENVRLVFHRALKKLEEALAGSSC